MYLISTLLRLAGWFALLLVLVLGALAETRFLGLAVMCAAFWASLILFALASIIDRLGPAPSRERKAQTEKKKAAHPGC